MFIYLDESGDLGFDFETKNPSSHFVMTLLVCNNQETAIIIKKSVERTRKNKLYGKQKYKNCSELKGSGTSLNIKTYFYKNAISSTSWNIYTIVLDKKIVLGKLPQPIDTHRIYNVLANHLLKKVNFSKAGTVNLFIDRSKDRDGINEFDDMLQITLSTILSITILIKIRHVTSHHSYGIQAVDLFCWGIFRKYVHGDEAWYTIFKDRIIYEQRFIEDNKKTAPMETMLL